MANIYTDIAMFDAEYYLANNPDLVAAGYTVANAGVHYVEYGANEGRMPNTWFDADFYQAQNPDLAAAGLSKSDLLKHFAQYGAFEGRNPSPVFGEGQSINAQLYLEYALANADLLEAFGIAADATRLTDEQAAQIVQHFFVYGVNEEREGGIAEFTTSNATKLEKALVDYTAKLADQTAADKAKADLEEKAGEGFDTKLGVLETAVREAAKFGIADADKITDESTAFARDGLVRDETIAQKQVDILKAQNPAVVNLQEKIAAYNSTAKAINETVTDYNAEAAKFKIANGIEEGVGAESLADAEAFAVTVDFKGAEDKSLQVKLVAEKGKIVVKTQEIVDAEAVLADKEAADYDEAAAKKALADAQKAGAEAIAEFNKLKGVDAFVAQVNALYGNIAIEAAATKAVEAATLKALQDAGYKVFDDKGEAVSWSNVKFDENGELDSAKEGKFFTVQLADKEGKPEGEALVGVLVSTGTIGADGKVAENSATLDGTALPPSITAAATASKEAVEDLQEAKDAIETFDKAVKEYNEAKELETQLKDATKAAEDAAKAVKAAEDAFEDLGVELVKAENGVATGATYNEEDPDQLADLFVYGDKKLDVNEFDGKDAFYFGDKVVAFHTLADDFDVTKGKLGGNNSVLDMFAVQNGADTVLYVETKAFAGASENSAEANSDFVKVTLTGVNADELQFEDGFLSFVA